MKSFTVLAVLALVACIKGQQPIITLTATNVINTLHVDNVALTPLPNQGDWQQVDSLPVDQWARLVSVRANNVIDGCSGILVAITDHPSGYEFVSDNQWKCSASAPTGWELLGYDDSTWTPAHQVGRNGGVTIGCSWIPLSALPENAYWIWTPSFNDGDMVVSCRGYTPICDQSPCQNGGTCNRNALQLCSCPVRWGGQFCELEVDECESNPCQHGGICDLTDTGYQCTCGIGYTGIHCETDVTDCASQPCQNGGSCIFEVDGGYHCDCVPGFDGNNCQNDIDECESEPCQNGATCIDAINGVQCQCVPGYGGLLCQTNINECASNPCLNAGTCTDLINGYSCQCSSGFQGDHCETAVGGCVSSPCLNGGTCTLNGPGGAVECICTPGWYGPTCASNADECSSNPCKNGGTCVDGEERFDCACPPEFAGDLCESVAPSCGSLLVQSVYPPTRNFWELCEINIIDHPHLINTPCRDLIVGIPYYNNSATIIALGGTFGCYPTKFPDEMPNGACIPNYNQGAVLGNCLSCTHMGVCIDVPDL